MYITAYIASYITLYITSYITWYITWYITLFTRCSTYRRLPYGFLEAETVGGGTFTSLDETGRSQHSPTHSSAGRRDGSPHPSSADVDPLSYAPQTTPPHPDDPAGSSHRETACVVWVMVASQAPPSSHDVHLRRSPLPAPRTTGPPFESTAPRHEHLDAAHREEEKSIWGGAGLLPEPGHVKYHQGLLPEPGHVKYHQVPVHTEARVGSRISQPHRPRGTARTTNSAALSRVCLSRRRGSVRNTQHATRNPQPATSLLLESWTSESHAQRPSPTRPIPRPKHTARPKHDLELQLAVSFSCPRPRLAAALAMEKGREAGAGRGARSSTREGAASEDAPPREQEGGRRSPMDRVPPPASRRPRRRRCAHPVFLVRRPPRPGEPGAEVRVARPQAPRAEDKRPRVDARRRPGQAHTTFGVRSGGGGDLAHGAGSGNGKAACPELRELGLQDPESRDAAAGAEHLGAMRLQGRQVTGGLQGAKGLAQYEARGEYDACVEGAVQGRVAGIGLITSRGGGSGSPSRSQAQSPRARLDAIPSHVGGMRRRVSCSSSSEPRSTITDYRACDTFPDELSHWL
ncbi:hypothetical protein JHW43_007739 [Diplocarpon mali]|nr:hypothetical protein JHW43_007739 [Diplocarpon mali]